MKKIMKCLLLLCLAVGMLYPSQIFASDTGMLTSFDIKGFGESIESGKYY